MTSARPERILLSLSDRSPNATLLPLPSRRTWVVGLFLGVFFAVFASIEWAQIASIRRQKIDDVFDLATVLFQGFWVLGWSVGTFILGALTFLFLFYGEAARIQEGRLIKISRLGFIVFRNEYFLEKIRDLRIEDAPGPPAGKVKIRFHYGGGTENLGETFERAHAESLVGAIRSAPKEAAAETRGDGFDVLKWVDSLAARRKAKPRPAAVRREPLSEPPPPAWNSPSSLALIAANLVPLFGVLFLGWDLGKIMVLFWSESAAVGFYNVLKLAVVCRWGALFTGPFFVGHFGGFMAGHFLFIYMMFVRGIGAKGPDQPVREALLGLFGPLWPALLALFISHGVSFAVNFVGRREYEGMTTERIMSDPYRRIFVMHLTIIFGGWLVMLFKTAVPALVLLILLKIAADLPAHRKERLSGVPVAGL